MYYDTIIIGLGGMGSAAAYHAARQGQRVLGLEQFQVAHAQGSSHGHSRIIRQAYFEDPAYVPLLKRAFTLWDELATHADEDLLHLTGGIMIGRPESTVIQGTLASIQQHQLAHRIYQASEIRSHFPALTPGDDVIAVGETQAGYVVPEATIRTHVRLATAHGAHLHFNETVQTWQVDSDGIVHVTTDRGTYRAAKLIVTVGAWAPQMLKDLGLPLHVERRVLCWFDPIGGYEQFDESHFPIYIWDCDDGISFYGFPYQPGTKGVKVAIHTVGQTCTPDTIDRQLHPEDIDHLQTLLRHRIPALGGALLDYATCMYTLTPDEHFLIGAHPTHANVILASPCSGHGFKFTPVIGEILADLAGSGQTAHDIRLFGLRF